MTLSHDSPPIATEQPSLDWPSLPSVAHWAWAAALLTYGLGDVTTTAIGLSVGATEMNPVIGEVLAAFGIAGFVGVKAIEFGAGYAIYRRAPGRYAVAVPVYIAAVGAFAVAWNLQIFVEVI